MSANRRRGLGLTTLSIALLAGSTVAFAVTEALKLDEPPATALRVDREFSPTCGCRTNRARLALTLRERETVDATIIDEDGATVRVLANGLERPAGPVRLTWDGRDDGGGLVPDGSYRLRIELRDDERTIVIPRPVRVDTAAPDVAILSAEPRVISPGRDDRTVVAFRTSESSRPVLLVDGEVAVRGRDGPPGTRSLAWSGRVRGRPVRRGPHELVIRARDHAGNVGASDPVTVRIR